MGFNQFYRRANRVTRRRSPEEMANLRRIMLHTLYATLAGVMVGGLLVLLLRWL